MPPWFRERQKPLLVMLLLNFLPAPPPPPLLPQSITMPSVPGMMGGRKAARKDDVRLAHAHLIRMLANNLPPGSLADNVVGGLWGVGSSLAS